MQPSTHQSTTQREQLILSLLSEVLPLLCKCSTRHRLDYDDLCQDAASAIVGVLEGDMYAPAPIPAGMTTLEEDQEELEDWTRCEEAEEEEEVEEED
jgi:hypothetical protein